MTTTLDAPATVPQKVLDGFVNVPPPTVGHVRQIGFMDTEIKPIYRLGKVVVGRAVTLKMTPGDATLTRPAIAALGLATSSSSTVPPTARSRRGAE